MSKIEAKVRKEHPELAEGFGNVPGLEWLPKGLVACSFHWYSVSVCNYVQLVGWLANDGCSDRVRTKEADRYQRSVLGNVREWRNKVGAHFAQVDPLKKDKLAVRTLSVTFPIGLVDGAFWAPPFKMSFTPVKENPKATEKPDERVIDTSGPEIAWSLTLSHKALCGRYSHFM